MNLAQSIITKKVHLSKIVTGFALGSQRLYDFVDDNRQVVFLDIEYVYDTSIIRRNDNVAAINNALQVNIYPSHFKMQILAPENCH